MADESSSKRARARDAFLTVIVPPVITLAFVTSETPGKIVNLTESGKMRTLFMSMAPNPVIGERVVFVSERRIVEVDLSVDEGIRALVTSGVALERAAAETDGVSPEQVRSGSPDARVGSYHSSMSDAAKRPNEAADDLDDPDDPDDDDRFAVSGERGGGR